MKKILLLALLLIIPSAFSVEWTLIGDTCTNPRTVDGETIWSEVILYCPNDQEDSCKVEKYYDNRLFGTKLIKPEEFTSSKCNDGFLNKLYYMGNGDAVVTTTTVKEEEVPPTTIPPIKQDCFTQAIYGPDRYPSLDVCDKDNVNRYSITKFDSVYKCVYYSDYPVVQRYKWELFYECSSGRQPTWAIYYDGCVWCTNYEHNYVFDGSKPEKCTYDTCYSPKMDVNYGEEPVDETEEITTTTTVLDVPTEVSPNIIIRFIDAIKVFFRTLFGKG